MVRGGIPLKSIGIFNSGIGEILFNPNAGHMGGAEIQHVYLAEELVRRGCRVSIITLMTSDPGQKRTHLFRNHRGIHVYLIPIERSGRITFVSYIRTMVAIWSMLRKINTDIYMQRGANYDTGFISLFCILHRKKFIFNIASDADLADYHDSRRSLTQKIVSNFGISHANLVLAQSKGQKKIYSTRWKRPCYVIKSLSPLKSNRTEKIQPPVILWVGTIRPEWKHPELYLQLARSIPSAHFQMVGGPSDDFEFYQKMLQESQEIPNLEFVGFVPKPTLEHYYSGASIFVNTSSVEGFPNTFIEAWLSCTPVISLNIDPDEIICEHHLGFHSKTFIQLVKDVETLLLNIDLREQMGRNGQSYVKREHSITKNVDQFIEFLSSL
jgi:glycosyltransferase involved in cell wall biosynthesis